MRGLVTPRCPPGSRQDDGPPRLQRAQGEAARDPCRLSGDHGAPRHRAISWIGRAEACGADDDARFIFLWIAFNAAYADENEFQSSAPGERAPSSAISVGSTP